MGIRSARCQPPDRMTGLIARPLDCLRGSILKLFSVEVEATGSTDDGTSSCRTLEGQCGLRPSRCDDVMAKSGWRLRWRRKRNRNIWKPVLPVHWAHRVRYPAAHPENRNAREATIHILEEVVTS